jgi:signal transduction histidine kinase
MFIFITITSTAIGYFAISKYRSSQIQLIDDSLDSKVKALSATNEDPLTVAQYLAEVSAIPVTVEYVMIDRKATVISLLGPDIPQVPSLLQLKRAKKSSINDGAELRIRDFALPNDENLLFADSLTTINAEVSQLKRELTVFIILTDLIAGGVAFTIFRRDGRLNQVSHLIAAQRATMQRFLGDASHELRTPLTVIKGYVELAQGSVEANKLKIYLERSSREIIRMESLINDLLFLAEVGESQEAVDKPIQVVKILQEHIDVLRALQPHRTITSHLDPAMTMAADSKLIDRVIGNLFSNVRRHTPEDATVNVIAQQGEKELRIIVEDGGPGLPEYPERSRFFNRFSTTRSPVTGGSGLGLSIINSVVEKYGGEIKLSRSELGGVKTEIIFPRTF